MQMIYCCKYLIDICTNLLRMIFLWSCGSFALHINYTIKRRKSLYIRQKKPNKIYIYRVLQSAIIIRTRSLLIIVYNEILFISSVIAAGLALIPATIAKNKGYSFVLWWFYGWLLFIVAIIHVIFLPDNNNENKLNYKYMNNNDDKLPSSDKLVVAELKKYKELLDAGGISEKEYEVLKNKLLQLI